MGLFVVTNVLQIFRCESDVEGLVGGARQGGGEGEYKHFYERPKEISPLSFFGEQRPASVREKEA